MIRRFVRQFAITWIALAFGSIAAQTGPQVTVGASVTVQVSDRDKTAAAAIARAEAMGGYFSILNNDALTVKVPANRSRELIEFIKTTWKPVDESYRADDVGASLDELHAGLKSKQELFAQFEKAGYIVTTDGSSTRPASRATTSNRPRPVAPLTTCISWRCLSRATTLS